MATDRLKNLVSAARARLAGPQAELPDIDDATRATIATVKDFTMTSPERLFATCEAVRYVVKHNIPGAIVECGVWRGGSSMAMLRTLQEVGDESREAYLFDTYEGMSEPTEVDVTITGEDAAKGMAEQEREGSPLWAYAPFEDVQRNVGSVGYPAERVHFVRGMVEDTIPEQAPEQIALLRLDTDFYESTKHELDHLIPRLAPYGVLIIDDYGHWEGARKAVDEWLAAFDRPVMLARTDYTGRIAIVPGSSS
ncbi:MAG: TylF/MycF/NovP-related O-methyltransferase [Nocardioides sp.]|jgi:O-methyltransferase